MPATQNQVPGAAVGNVGNTVNSAEINLGALAGGAIYGYSGAPATGNLTFSLTTTGGTDNYANPTVTGLSVASGVLSSVNLLGATMDSASTLVGTQIQTPSVLSPTVVGGTASSLVHTMTNTSGAVLGYTSGNFSQTFATSGTYQFTVPTGVTSLRVQAWGAGAGGGGGGSTQGGESGGGGEYAEEPSYPVTPGEIVLISVGKGGQGAGPGDAGNDGGQTTVVPPQGASGLTVTANPGLAGVNYFGGQGGSGSTNTIHYDGGNGADASGQTGGAGGGSSAGPTGQGNQGFSSASSTGGAGATPPTGGGAGGSGGNDTASGTDGSKPGGGGGGCGAAAGTSKSTTFSPSGGTYSYFGENATNGKPNGIINHDGYMYQGKDPNVPSHGYQYSFILLPYATIMSTLAGNTVNSVSLRLRNLSAANSTVLVELKYTSQTSFGSTGPGVDALTVIQEFWMNRGQTKTQNVGLGDGDLGRALQGGQCRTLAIGAGDIGWGSYTYGYFDSGANGGTVPELTVNYTVGPSSAAGNGADGQVIISYGSSSPEYTVGISSVSQTDTYGNPVQAGVTAPALTLSNSATAATAVDSAGVITASSSGTPTVTNTSGFVGNVALTQADVTTYTSTGGNAAISMAYTIPTGDMQAGTTYVIDIPFTGTFSATHWTFGLVTNGSVSSAKAQTNTGDAAFPGGVQGFIQYRLQCQSTGAAGISIAACTGGMGSSGTRSTGSNANSIWLGASGSLTVNTNIQNVIYVLQNMGTGTINAFGSTFTRLGP